jgi:membrane-associated phospholipid phosphatase
MATETMTDTGQNYSSAIRELATSAKDLIEKEIGLVKAEVVSSAHKVSRHSTQAAVFAGLLAVSIIPFIAFLVIGLGEILDGRYWLSSLIVAVVFAVVGGVFAYRAFKKITEEDLQLPRTKATLEREKMAVQNKIDELKYAAKGGRYEPAR